MFQQLMDNLLGLLNPEDEQQAALDPALCAAVLMYEVVQADHSVSDAELISLSRSLAHLFDTEPDRLQVILETARQTQETSVGVYEFTRTLNERCDQESKVKVVAALWQIAWADDHVDDLEEHTIRRISDLLYVSHSDFIAAKLAAKKA